MTGLVLKHKFLSLPQADKEENMKEVVGINLLFFWVITSLVDTATGSLLLPALVRTAETLGFSHPKWQVVGSWLALPIVGVLLLFSSSWKKRR